MLAPPGDLDGLAAGSVGGHAPALAARACRRRRRRRRGAGRAGGGRRRLLRREGDDLLKELLEYIMKDESRHVGFGMLALRDAVRKLGGEERRALEEFAFAACDMTITKVENGVPRDGFRSYQLGFEEMGIPYADHIMNAVVLTAVLSCLNSGLYTASRMLFVLAARREAPMRLITVNNRGVPGWFSLGQGQKTPP